MAEFTKVECISQLPEIVQINCTINRTFENISALYVEFILFQDIYAANGIFTLFFKHGNKSIKYDTQNIDYCSVLGNFHNQYFFRMFIAGVRRISNIPLKCPFKKVNNELVLFFRYNLIPIIFIFLQDQIYYVNGFTVDPKIIPSYFPELSFNSETTINWNGKLVGCFKTFGNLRRRKITIK